MRSGELARADGVKVETLRYYERRGLLAQPPRLAPGYRGYPSEALNRIRLIKQAQALGAHPRRDRRAAHAAAPRRGHLHRHGSRIRSRIAGLDSKLTALTGLRGSLERLLCECCHSQCAARECPALRKHAST